MADGQSIYYDGVNIIGDLNLSSLPGSRTLSRLQLINCSVASATFKGLTMDSDLVLWGTTFGNASFDKASFLGTADLANTSFQHSSFRWADFSGPVVFDGARFQGDVSFEDASVPPGRQLQQCSLRWSCRLQLLQL